MAIRRYAGPAACLWLIFDGASWADDSFSFLAPDGTVWIAKPGVTKLVDEGGVGPLKFAMQTDDAHFDLSRGDQKLPNQTWFEFIGTNNGIFAARSNCSYTHENAGVLNEGRIICNFTWHDVPQTFDITLHQMSLFDGNGNCTLISLNDVTFKSGVPTVNQVHNPDPNCQNVQPVRGPIP
jgi:hypothetical protein